jgi:uncharacterized damage-inducible protein DinB
MTMRRAVTTTVMLVIGGTLWQGCAPPPEPAADPGPAPTAVAAALRQSWQSARANVAQSAEIMAEADYAFRPVDSVRTFGQILSHLAGANYVFCSSAKGEAPPHAEDAFEETVTSRDEIIKVLGESLAYCDTAYDAATDASLAETVPLPFDQGDGARATALLGNVGHLNEHYGNLVTYFRIKGIVPPSSRGQ